MMLLLESFQTTASQTYYILPGAGSTNYPSLKLLGRAGLDRSAYGFAPSVSTQQMRDVTCLRTNRTATTRPAGLDRSAFGHDGRG